MSLNNMGLGFIFTAKDLASGTMAKVKDSFGEVKGEAGMMGSVVKGAFKSFGTGLAIMGAGLAGLALLEPAIAESMELSKAIALVATEADLAIYPQERMRQVAEELAVTYGKAPVDQAKALYKAVALGANDAAKSTAFLNGVNLLAVAGNADLELSANALGGALNAYGAPFSKATDYSDALFTAMKMGNTTVQDLAGAIGRVTSSAANLNISIEEVLGAVSVMTNKGVAAAEAVSGLKEALANVIHPSADAAKEAARLGIKFDQTTLRSMGLQKFLEKITTSSKFTASSLSKLFTSVEGSNAIVQIASGNMGSYNSVMEEMAKKTGATQKGFEIINQTLDFQKQKFEANKKVALGQIGAVLEPMAAATLRVVNAFLEGFSKIPKPVLGFFVKMFAGVSVMLTLLGGVIAAKAAIVLLVAGLKAAGITFGGLALAMLPALVMIGGISLALYGLREAYEKNIGGFGDYVDHAVKKVSLAFKALGQLFSQGGFSGAVRDELNAGNGEVKQFAINVFAWVKRVQHFFEGIGEGFSAGVEQARPAIEAFMGALTRLGVAIGFISDGESVASASSTWRDFGATGAKVGLGIAKVFEFVVAVITAVVDISSGLADGWKNLKVMFIGVGTALSGVGSKFVDLLVQMHLMNDATSGGANGWHMLGSVIAGVIGVFLGVIEIMIAVVQTVVSAVSGIVGIVESLFSGIIDIANGFILIFRGIMAGDWSMIWNGMKTVAFGVVDAIIGVVLELVGAIAGAADALIGLFGRKTNMQAGLQDFKNSLHNDMAKDMGVLPMTGERKTVAGGVDAFGTGEGTMNWQGGARMGGQAPAPGPAMIGPMPTQDYIASTAARANMPDLGGDVASLSPALEQIARNTSEPKTTTVIVNVDSEEISRRTQSAKKTDAARSFTPSQTPT